MLNSRRNRARNHDRHCPYYCCGEPSSTRTLRTREKREVRRRILDESASRVVRFG